MAFSSSFQQVSQLRQTRAGKLIFLLAIFMRPMLRDTSLQEHRLVNNYNLCVEDIFPRETVERQIIRVNKKHSAPADETSRTRFKTRFQVSGNERCNAEPSPFFSLPPPPIPPAILSFCVSKHCNLTIYGLQGAERVLSLPLFFSGRSVHRKGVLQRAI